MLIMEDQSVPDLRRFYLGHAQVNRAVGSPRRCLFGPSDPEESRRFAQNEMRQIYEHQKKKWNFDFEREEPVPGGRFLWERVGGPKPEQSRTEASFGSEEAAEQSPDNAASPAAAPAPAAAAAAAASRPARQPPITDLLRTRKRQHTAAAATPAKPSDEAPSPKRPASPDRDTL